LGHPYFVRGIVRHGDKRGRDLGFPTANLVLDDSNRLAYGVYAVTIVIDGQTHDGVASFGRRPTFDNGAPLLEVFVFDFNSDLYGKDVEVAFYDFIRHEAKFNDINELIAQMQEDSARARQALARR
jgi:riboflavin kinase/FMN adenylyltransferase